MPRDLFLRAETNIPGIKFFHDDVRCKASDFYHLSHMVILGIQNGFVKKFFHI